MINYSTRSWTPLLEYTSQKILAWDCEDIYVLRDTIVSFKEAAQAAYDCGEVNHIQTLWEYGVDISELPSIEIPEGVNTLYPLWAMDKRGMCLVGETLEEVAPLQEILEK